MFRQPLRWGRRRGGRPRPLGLAPAVALSVSTAWVFDSTDARGKLKRLCVQFSLDVGSHSGGVFAER